MSAALSSLAVRSSAGGVPRHAAAAPSDAFSGKKRPRVGVAPAPSSSACLTEMTRGRNGAVAAAGMEVFTVGRESSSQVLMQKRLASELDVLRRILQKAERISRGGEARKGAAPTAGEKERLLTSKSNQRAKPIDENNGGNAPSVKRRRISAVVEQKQKQIVAPRMSREERNQIGCRLSSLSGQLAGHIVEFLQKEFGDADAHGEIQINMDSVQDSVLFELKTHLDKFAEESKNDKVAEQSKDDKVAEQSKDDKVAEEKVVLRKEAEEYADISIGLSCVIETGSKPSSSGSGVVQQIAKANKVHDDVQRAAINKPVYMPSLLYRANLRRQLLEMERAVLPDQSIDPRDLQRLGVNEYGHPRLMRQLGLILKAVEA